MASATEHAAIAPTSYSWDPLSESSASAPSISPAALRRIQVDIKELRDSPIPGIFVVPDDDKVSRMHALITGPEGTPYENGFFYFLVQFPHDYPLAPPQVRIMTTGGGTVRFNPNFYANGKSLMAPMPLHNEPGYESVLAQFADAGKLKEYNDIIRHETLRVAVLNNVEDTNALPAALRRACLINFVHLAEIYDIECESYAMLDGTHFKDMFSVNQGTFRFGEIRARLAALADKYLPEVAAFESEEAE